MKIICIGRNYAEHAQEMASPVPEKPIFFFKPDTTLLRNNEPFFYPLFSNEVHYELEIVVKINRLGRNIAEKFAHRYYNEIGLGIDFTARDLQQECKQKGLPWEIAKAFDGAAPISHFISLEELGGVSNIDFWLEKNEETVQRGNTSQMIFSIDRLIAYVSQFVTIKIGDLIFTGTPSGVGPVKIGDRLKAYMNNKLMLDFFVR
ncbi:MAG: fumarylacetoacetate hydrolase family protein [Bacteroidales bacterium]|jgi:2-keto-4-pentenoate hydratase/2-oxohepta-3-ene-1,7-dioic acid hydratase in catechol pathway|nr:fumarylacetoacetate hydrolase family protein [Bacteroidales bacterium]MDD4385254.1 fumarylacetoacetate hydrolase family protein [Bacteroidales bacterium]MDY0198005.1 fumarylacetoacetate hydrolase family protein [Tenuifilaceae bacterium]